MDGQHARCNAVGTPQGVAGLAPRPFTLGEETGSHHMVMYTAPACSSACTSGAHLHLPPHRRSSIIVIGARGARRAAELLPPSGVPSDSRQTATCPPPQNLALFMLFMLFMQLARSTLEYP